MPVSPTPGVLVTGATGPVSGAPMRAGLGRAPAGDMLRLSGHASYRFNGFVQVHRHVRQ